MKNDLRLMLSLAPLLAFSGCTSSVEEKKETPQQEGTKAMNKVKTDSGLAYEITKEGAGDSPEKGKTVTVHYTGWLNENGERGKKFDSSIDRGQPFEFPIGMGYVIKGWDEGVMGMKTGEKRTLYIPAELGYGARGAGGVIPPHADLIFDVELIKVS